MKLTPQDSYLSLMKTIRGRFDLVYNLKTKDDNEFTICEIVAFNGRKIIEGIAFGCLVALENGISHIPRDTKGQWNAQEILKSLEKKNFDSVFPSPSIIRQATEAERSKLNVKVVVDGQPERRILREDFIQIYSRLHRWAHELNPYTETEGREGFLKKHKDILWNDIDILWRFIEKHTISINKQMFFCILKDNNDSQTKICSLSKLG